MTQLVVLGAAVAAFAQLLASGVGFFAQTVVGRLVVRLGPACAPGVLVLGFSHGFSLRAGWDLEKRCAEQTFSNGKNSKKTDGLRDFAIGTDVPYLYASR
ncbi:TPA: hypothetical protein VDT70_001335 [Pseudomonas aeruginosa]|nr:hypothetical protein [Pseudomonas aeruginosa]